MIVFKTTIELEQLSELPTARNSNLFPVNANGDVRFLSVLSNKISGIFGTLIVAETPAFVAVLALASKSFNTFSKVCPTNTLIIAGGASLAPKR